MSDNDHGCYEGFIMGKHFCSEKCRSEYRASQNQSSDSGGSGCFGGLIKWIIIGIIALLVYAALKG